MWKTRLGYLIFIVLMGLLALLYNNRFTLLLFLSVLALPIVSLILLAASVLSVNIRHLPVPVTVEKGESVPVELIVENRFILPVTGVELDYWYRNDYIGKKRKGSILFACGARKIGRVRLEFSADYCGNITVAADRLKFMDLVGMWRFQKKLKLTETTAVLPEKILFPDRKLPENYAVYSEFETKNAKPGGDDPAELISIREYIPGDRMNRIHWKKSGAMDTLFVKEFADTAQGVSVILVELRRQAPGDDGLTLLDGILEAAFSLSERLTEQKKPHFLAWYDEKTKRIERRWMDSEESFYEAIGALYGCVLAERGTEEPVLLYPACYPKEQYAHMIYVGADLSEETAARWAALAGSSVCRLVCVEGPGERMTEEEEEQLKAIPVIVERVSLIKAGDGNEA